MDKPPPSVPYFAFAQGMLALFPATVTALILFGKDILTGGGVWISLVNSFVAGGVCGLVVGTAYNLLGRPAEGSRSLTTIFTSLMIDVDRNLRIINLF